MTNKCINTFLTLLTVAAPFGAVADRFYVVPADLEPGKTETLRFVLENSQDYYGFQAEVKLPEGLTALENSEGDLDITLSSRADGGNYMLNSNTLGDGMLIMGAFSASHMSFTGDDGVLVNLNVSVADDFAGGTVELSDIMFIDSQDKDVEFDSTSAYFGVAATAISISMPTLTITEDETAALSVTFTPGSATDKTVTWTSSDESVATVSADGVVTGVKAGTATIMATSANGLTATCEVTVEAKIIAVESIAISSTELTLTEGDNATLVATIAPTDATDKNVTWASSDETVATVSAGGVVTAVKAGKATITVTSSNGKTATCEVTVDAKIIFVESLTIDPTTWSGVVGSEFKITATVLPA
ncbi:MAG: Ig domain-containing protein, partial [Bacteroides sp.]|nr:Ig domain-containing protein [Bacteroides sp.]